MDEVHSPAKRFAIVPHLRGCLGLPAYPHTQHTIPEGSLSPGPKELKFYFGVQDDLHRLFCVRGHPMRKTM